MTRPTDWTTLGHFGDPVPGDPGIVQESAAEYRLVAEAIDRAARNLEHLVRGDSQVSDAVRALIGQAEQEVDRIARAEERYAGVARALGDYVSPLAQAQAWSVEALTSATGAHAAISDADDAIRRNLYASTDDSLSPSDRLAYEQVNEDLARDRASAEQVMASSVQLLQQAIDHRDSAATTASNAIREVENSGALNDSFWDNVDQFFEDNKGWIDTVITIAGFVAALLVVVALVVPGLNLIVLAVIVLVTTATILNAAAQALTGNKTWAEAILEIGLALVPFGVGRVIGRGASTVHAATSSAAATSIMRSAAGQGISGVSRAVAAQSVSGVSGAAYSRILVGSDVRVLAEIRAMAGIRLASGAPSEFVARTAKPGSVWLGAWATNEVGLPLASPVVPNLLPKSWTKDTTHTVQDTKW